ncbi:methyltransferase [Sciscionella marina]|uniref:methyltransferase n=1 Tax=Sciscionella marina TaxID=508770 RepID=UPI003B837A3F
MDCDGVSVTTADHLDGGGSDFGKAYIRFFKEDFVGKTDSLLEWCCGPGFIGFSLLGRRLCKTLTLIDINREAVDVCSKTIQGNGLACRASAHRSDCFDDVPAEARWDIIVGNPPHVNTRTPGSTDFQRRKPPVIYLDTDWAIHRRFYNQVQGHLRPGGSVVLQEKYRFADPMIFQSMAEDAGLAVVGAVQCSEPYEEYYFMWTRLPL